MSFVSSDPATPPATPTEAEIDLAEQSAQIAVGLIRRFVDTIRSVDAFAPIPNAALSAIRGNKRRQDATERTNACSSLALEDVRLMPLLRETNFMDDVVSACGTGEGELLVEQSILEVGSSDGERDRLEVVNAICIPLLTLLAECYAVLDIVPQAMPLQRKGGQKPKPPKGLLSIADYTDCACLLEFLVSTSILPNLDASGAILPCPQDRVKMLPKSLSGRVHRRSLLWGDAVKVHSASKSIDECAWRDKMNELRKSSKAIGYVIALERFRPMLLPRHAADILAALFQSDRYQELLESKQTTPKVTGVQVQDSHVAMLNIYLGRGARTVQVAVGSQSICIQAVDPHTRARAYQSLLSGGTKTPQWLRRKVGSLLNSLAAANLRCVVDVFVVAASSMPTDDISAASARLGRVLCSVPPSAAEVKAIAENRNPGCSTNAHRYYQRLFQQLALLLDIASASSMAASKARENGDVDTNFDPRIVAGVLTVWAVIDNVPYHVLERFALPMLANGLVPLQSIGKGENTTESETKRPPLRISVRRILSLYSFAPTTALALGNIYHLLILPLRVDTSMSGRAWANDGIAGNITVLGQLVRVVAAGENNVVESSRVIQDALLALRMVVHGMSRGDKAVRVAGLAGQDIVKIMSLALVDSVCINAMDVAGFQYKQVLDGGKHDVVLDSLPNVAELGDLARAMGSRAKIVVVDIVAKLIESNEQTSSEGANGSEQGSDLPSVLFCLLLLIYFGDTGRDRGQNRGKREEIDPLQFLPASLRRNFDTAKLAAMSMLPLCCEYCSPATLVLGNASPASEESADSFGVLTMIEIIITSIAHRKQVQLVNMEDYRERPGNIQNSNNADCRAASNKFMDYASCDLSTACSGVYVLRSEDVGKAGIDDKPEGSIQKDGSSDDEETLLSIGSIVVSLLVALLELGEEKRLPKEEKIISSLLPGLELLSSPGDRNDGHAGDTLPRLQSEIAEMASHAVALIHSRGVIRTEEGNYRVPRAPGLTIQEKICQAEQDLHSDQPPIRARGVVGLRHVAQSFVKGLKYDSSLDISSEAKPLVVEIDGDNRVDGDNTLSTVSTLEQLMRLCLETLQDSESYVYLAAIQTLVAIADANAAKVVPILGRAISLGVIDFSCDASSSPTSAHHLMLSSVQRIKATEALLFAIRRRGDGIFAFGNELLELMLFGCHAQSPPKSKSENNSLDRAAASTIQSKTEIFFLGERTDDYVHESEDTDMDAEEEERCLRINTGGPVFDTEEEDVVRAGCISIVAELVAALPPVGLVRYCPALLELGKQVLRLDASRPMRRAAALLCRETYSVIIREFDDAKDENDTFLSFATAMASCDEETLRATLERCLSANDVDLVVGAVPESGPSSHAVAAVQGKVRLADPATMARCQEALEIRASIDEVGIWAAARLLAASKTNQDKDDPATRAIIRRLQQAKKHNNRDSVQAMQGLRIDGDSLAFL